MKKAIILSAVLALISVVALSAQRRVASTDDKTNLYMGVSSGFQCP